MNKKAIEMSFTWIFAIIVGAVIIFIAIYFASQLIDSGSYEVNTKTAQQLADLLDPLQTVTEEGKADRVDLISDTRIYTSCNEEGDFGNNVIEISEKFGFKGDWSDIGGDISKQNAYLFAEPVIETEADKTVYYFIRSFEMPFKVADLIIMHTQTYCFVSAPGEIKREIDSLGESVNIRTGNCEEGDIQVCFGSGNCDIRVQCVGINCDSGVVEKDGNGAYFIGDLVYAAIFSSKEDYECNVRRLMMRLSSLGELYAKKAQFMSARGCDTGLYTDILLLAENANNFEDLEDINRIQDLAENIERGNSNRGCRLF